ncbi:MAG: penicillin-binding transpeptidase domain-containing protein [Opitutaceae bacterium]|nr:penicillin-binding transpeptidase domain-containing protein [Opitutaceae bacterium]
MSIIETYKPQRPRLLLFHFLIVGMMLVLATGLAYRQLFRSGDYGERERLQNQRRVLVPGPRGNIYDRDGRLLVGNRSRFAVTLYLDELRGEFRTEYIEIVRSYRESETEGDITRSDRPSPGQLEQIARAQVVQRYLDQINRLLGRSEKVDLRDLNRHFQQQLLLPYILLDDLKPEEYARLIERLPVESPLQVYTSSTRFYPYASAAAHTLGYVGASEEVSVQDVPGEDLKTYAFKGTVGRDGLELRYDALLQGETGGTIYRVDPAGFRVNPPLEKRMPVQGHNLVTSLDIDLQLATEQAMKQFDNLKGAAVALDVHTGEVLVLASVPDYDLNAFSPRLSTAAAQDINDREAWTNRAIGGVYPPGSTFKLITTLAGLRSGRLTAAGSTAECGGTLRIGGRTFYCDKSAGGYAHHGVMALREAIAQSCDIFFYTYGLQIGPNLIAAEARRFHLDQPAGIDLPHETRRMLIPDPAWKQRVKDEAWFDGDTANMAIGQGFVGVTPLGMACLTASLARGETTTRPTLIHDPDRAPQHTEPIGLAPGQYAAVLDGMEGCTTRGTARILTANFLRIPGLRIAGKTGTAQTGPLNAIINIAWFVCFAPVDDPQIAVAVAIEGDRPGETYAGGRYAAPVAQAVLKAWFEKKQQGGAAPARLTAN